MTDADQIRIYGTGGCHLCEQAEELIGIYMNRYGLPGGMTRIDIAYDESLLDRFGEKIPVIERLDIGTELCWPFGFSELETFLK